MAKDNAEAAFVNVDEVKSGFYATRCYIQLSGGNATLLSRNHIEGTVSISNVVARDEQVDVYNVSGAQVASKATLAQIQRLQPGVYVIKGKKVMIK